jgi:hypothetical protein
MIAAPNLETVKKHVEEHPTAICCILFAPKFSSLGFDNIIPRIVYLDSRTGKDIHFYCAGYGACWIESWVPDMVDVGVGKYEGGEKIEWKFSQKLFANFCDELERKTSWRYSGGSEIIVLNSKVDFSNCIVFKLDAMIEDKIIKYPGELLEALIQFARKKKGIDKISKKGIRKILGEESVSAVLGFLPKPFENLVNLWKKGRHYELVDIS